MVKEKFLLDSNTFITPYKNYYPFDFASSFWHQLLTNCSLDNVAVLDSVKEEVLKGEDELSAWMNSAKSIKICSRKDVSVVKKYSEILIHIQNSSLYNEKALRVWSKKEAADPWLIAVAAQYGYTIITFETSSGIITTPSGRPKIPDIGKEFGVHCENLFYFMRKMNFKL